MRNGSQNDVEVAAQRGCPAANFADDHDVGGAAERGGEEAPQDLERLGQQQEVGKRTRSPHGGPVANDGHSVGVEGQESDESLWESREMGGWEDGDGRMEMGDGRWEDKDGRWEDKDGRWEDEDGRMEMGDGDGRAVHGGRV